MVERIIHLEIAGDRRLGFDTGLSAQAFAQAKLAQFITQRGVIVYPDGRVETWKADSVTELAGESGAGIMVIQGPFFPGESLDSVLRDSSPDESLDAVRFWLKARQTLYGWESRQSPEESGAYFPGAAGALLVTKSDKNFPRGTILFPPERLVKRCIEAEGDRAAAAAQQWRHPDLRGDDEIAFSAGIMLYTVFTGALPFIRDDSDTIRQDMREGVYMPPELAAPAARHQPGETHKRRAAAGQKNSRREKAPLPFRDHSVHRQRGRSARLIFAKKTFGSGACQNRT